MSNVTATPSQLPLFREFPRLREVLPHASLGDFPTPIHHCQSLGKHLRIDALYLKRDDLTGRIYGGNKVRKLEFLLGKALREGAREVMTFGFTGSNHALATAIYAREVGLRSISMFMPQPNSESLRRNLLLGLYFGAELHEYPNKRVLTLATAYQVCRHLLKTGRRPMLIPPGGSSPLGIVGIINAAFELRDQIAQGDLPEPGCIYVAVGSMGTAVGLTIGLRAAGLGSRVVPVRVIHPHLASPALMGDLARNTLEFLRGCDPSFPACEGIEREFALREDFFGERYALYTQAGMDAIALLHKTEGVTLDGTYSGKAMAALVSDAQQGELSNRPILFWDTYNSQPIWDSVPLPGYHELPGRFHRYFENPVQPLDRQ